MGRSRSHFDFTGPDSGAAHQSAGDDPVAARRAVPRVRGLRERSALRHYLCCYPERLWRRDGDAFDRGIGGWELWSSARPTRNVGVRCGDRGDQQATAGPAKAGEEQKALEEARKDVETQQTTRNNAAEALRNCKDDTTCQTAKGADLSNAASALQKAQAQFFQKLVTAMGDVAAGATSQASASFYQGVSAVSKNPRDIAHELSEIQRKFVERINPDTFAVACLTVLAEEGASPYQTELANLCKSNLGPHIPHPFS
jgi:hypothetical protein